MDIKIETEGKKNFIVIRAELPAKPEPSNSGKSLVLATTSGNKPTGVKWNGKDVIAGINIYVKKGE